MDSTKEIEDYSQQIIIWMIFKFLYKKIYTQRKVKDTIKYKKVMKLFVVIALLIRQVYKVQLSLIEI